MAYLGQLSSEIPAEERIQPCLSDGAASASAEPSLSRNLSSSRLNAQAPEFVPRLPVPKHAPALGEARMIHIHHAPPPPPVMHIFHPPPPPSAFHHLPIVRNHASLEFYGGGGGGFRDHDPVPLPMDSDQATVHELVGRDGLSDDVIRKVTKQRVKHHHAGYLITQALNFTQDDHVAHHEVEYYFSDANLATTEHLMRFISKDPEGYVPISVIAAFKKIKTFVNNTSLLAAALQTSSKLAVSDDGKKVKRLRPITNADLEELQSRIIVAENLPEDHCYQNLFKIFSVVGSVKTIRTCYPQAPNGTTSAVSTRPAKMDTFLGNKLHAFVEFESVEDAEKAVADLNDKKNWRSGLRVRLLSTCITKHGQDVSISDQPSQDPAQSTELSSNYSVERGARHGRGRGRGCRARSRGHYHPVAELPTVVRLPPGPRMPDGTKGFNMGRGRPIAGVAP